MAVVLAVLLFLSACGEGNVDPQTLRRRVAASEQSPRTLSYRATSQNVSYVVKGTIEDDLRYQMTLQSAGKDLVSYVVNDDALAIRLLDPSFGERLANELGHPRVDAALRAGRWVIDPSGAPPIVQRETVVGGETTGDPFRDAREVFRFLTRAIGEARAVREFQLEDVEYRPAFDPWRYPDEENQEARFDMLRPFIPLDENQIGRSSGDVGINHFRKLSVFTKSRLVTQICEFVDVLGHEEFIRLREEGPDSNPFLQTLLKRIQTRQTSVPIETRRVVTSLGYSRVEPVETPVGAVPGKLDVFQSAFQQAVSGGVLRPQRGESFTDCRRT